MDVDIKGFPSSFECFGSTNFVGPATLALAWPAFATRDAKGSPVSRQRQRHGVFQRYAGAAIMSLHNVTPGAKAPEQFNVIIEIPMNADPVKYEVDKASGAIFVDRFMTTSMHYPCNYGYVPQTLSNDGDPCDVLVITPYPLVPGVVVTCRPIGVLMMDDEAGGDAKILAVPIDKILPIYTHWQKPEDMNQMRLKTIQHFFEHYKDLEAGKWVKVKGWEGPDAAKEEIRQGTASYLQSQKTR
jgi:inorganic pyrophosphatase